MNFHFDPMFLRSDIRQTFLNYCSRTKSVFGLLFQTYIFIYLKFYIPFFSGLFFILGLSLINPILYQVFYVKSSGLSVFIIFCTAWLLHRLITMFSFPLSPIFLFWFYKYPRLNAHVTGASITGPSILSLVFHYTLLDLMNVAEIRHIGLWFGQIF